jgi:hypothetical protein
MATPAENIVKPPQRFVVYVQENASSFIPNPRLIILNLRCQTKGLGSCAIRYLPKNAFDYDETIQPKKCRPAQRFVVVDTNGLEEIPSEMDSLTEAPVIFYGRFKNITLEKYKDTDEYTGEISGDEDGWYYYQKTMFNCDDIPFNANIDGFYIGNRVNNGGDFMFEKYNPVKLKDSEVGETMWSDAQKEAVWSLEEAIDYVGNVVGAEINMPWDMDNLRITENNNAINVPEGETLEQQSGFINSETHKKKYKIFLDKKKPKSYSSCYGKSLVEWLDENLLDNFTYRFRYISSGFVTVDIINTSLVDTDLFPKAILPFNIVTNPRTTSLSVTDIGETYTDVEVISNRVLFTGTLTTKNLGVDQKTMDRTWEYSDEKNFAYGSDNGIISPSPDVFRRSWKNQRTYNEYKFLPSGGCPITVSPAINYTNDFSERNLTPFFPFVSFNTNGSIFISESMNSHKTPDTANMKWADKLPFGYSESTSKYHLYEPFVSITCTTELEPNKKSIVPLCGGNEKPTIEVSDLIHISTNPAQALGYILNDAKLFTLNGQDFAPSTNPASGAGGSYDWKLGAAAATLDPATTSLAEYPLLSHWSMIYITLAGYSSQRLSLTKQKTNPGIEPRKKVIQADDCEYWIAHPGTFKQNTKFDAAADAQGYVTVPEVVLDDEGKMLKPKVIRNDYKKQKSYLDMYSAFLFLEKKSVTLDFTVDGWENKFAIGQPIGSVKDTQVIPTNSVIESIEYFIEGTNPRIRVTTLIPELPPLKKLGETIRIEGSQPQMSRMSKYKEPKVKTEVEEKRTTITRIQGTGGGGVGGGAFQKSDICYLIGGNQLAYLGEGGLGITHLTTKLETVTVAICASLGLPSILPNGLGWAKSIDDNSFKLIINDNRSLCQYDLISNQHVFAGANVNITGAAGVVYPARLVAGPI